MKDVADRVTPSLGKRSIVEDRHWFASVNSWATSVERECALSKEHVKKMISKLPK
jgi:hypothetical protein